LRRIIIDNRNKGIKTNEWEDDTIPWIKKSCVGDRWRWLFAVIVKTGRDDETTVIGE
jgi:hypothetical protein